MALLWPAVAQGQLVYAEGFTNETAPGWAFSQGNTSPGPRLTANATPDANDPESGAPTIDNPGNGWLRLATTTGNQSNAVAFDTSFAGDGADITIGFDFAFWKPTGSPADGITAFLWDAAQPFSPGAFGGSLGYANRTGVDGLGGGYVGAGLDVFGNFSNPTEGRNGGTSFKPGQVAVRGPGSGQTGYNFLGGTDSGTVDSLTDVFGSGFRMDFPNSPNRPDQDASEFRRFEMQLDSSNNLTVRMQSGFSGAMTDLFTVAIPGARPDQLRFGFAGSTGGLEEVYEIRNLDIEVVGGTNAFYWDDENGNTLWNTGTNWDKDSVPGNHDYVFFTDQFPDTTTAQTVDLNVSPVLDSMTFNGSTSYTLNGSGGITFDTDGGGASSLNILNSPNGNADHSIANAITLANDLNIDNLADGDLLLSGGIDTTGSGYTLNIRNAVDGTTESTGVISGSGDVIVRGNGTTTFAADNTYAGSTTVENGILRAEDAGALGTTGTGTTVEDGGTLGLAGGITFDSENLTISGGGEGGLGALRNLSGTNIWTGNTTLDADATVAADAGTTLIHSGTLSTGTADHDLTLRVGSGGQLTVSGQITDPWSAGSGLIKTGTGNATLSANNGYTGTTAVEAGTLTITDNGALGAAWSSAATGTTVSDGGTLALDGTFSVSGENLFLNGDGAAGAAALWSANGTQTWNSTIELESASSIGVANGSDTLTLGQAITGNGEDLTIRGAGTVDLSGGANLNSIGDLTIEGGTFDTSIWNQINDNARVTVEAGGTLDLQDGGETVGSLAGAGDVQLSNTATSRILTFGGDDTDSTFSGTFDGAAGLTKTGSGNMTLTGSNTATGTFTVDEGTLTLGATDTLDDAMDMTLDGGTLAIDGISDTLDAFTLQSTSDLDFLGEAGGYLTFDDMTRNGGQLTIDNWIGNLGGNGDTRLQVTAGSLGGSLIDNITFTGWGDATLINLGGGLYEVVPETSGFFEWDGEGANDNWSAGVNQPWVDNTAPPDSTAGTQVLFGDAIPDAPETVTLNGNRTVGTMVINATGSRDYTFTADGDIRELIFDGTGSTQANLTVLGDGEHIIGRTGSGNFTDIRASDDLRISNNATSATGLTLGQAGGDDYLHTSGNTVTFQGSGTTVVNSEVRDAGDLVIDGPGTVRLNNGSSPYSGGTTLDGGTLQIGDNDALGSGDLTLNGGTVEAFGADRTIDNSINLDGDVTFGGSNDLTFQGGSNETIGWSGNRTLTIDPAVTATFGDNRDLTGSGALTVDGGGTLNLEGGDTSFSGGLTVDDGAVTVGSSASRVNSALRFGGGSDANAFLGNGDITVGTGGELSVFKSGNGNIDFRNDVTLTNNGGTVTIDSSGGGSDLSFGTTGGNTPGTFTQTAGTTDITSGDDIALNRNSALDVSGGTATFTAGDDFTTGGTAAQPAAIDVSGGGTLALDLENGTGSRFALDADDTINVDGNGSALEVTGTAAGTGSAEIDGTVVLADNGVMRIENLDTELSGTAQLNGGAAAGKGTVELVDADLTIDPNAEITNAPNVTMTVNGSGSQTFDSTTAGSNVENLGTVSKTGTGDLTLGGNLNNVQAERLVIEGGTLLLSDDDQIANSTPMDLAGGTFGSDGNSEVVGTLTLSADSEIDLGAGASVLEFAASDGETWTDPSKLVIENWSGDRVNGGGTDQVIFGNMGLTNDQLGKIVFRNPAGLAPGVYGATWLGNEIVPEAVPVPEPGAVIGGILLSALAGWRERRRLQEWWKGFRTRR
ncbi:MAG: autotransporter-associated beta strand repeat-containing protein [Opitutales bacterium]